MNGQPSPLLAVTEALARIVAMASRYPRTTETIPVGQAAGRVLAADLVALRTQPPFAMSAMDGYALRAADAEAGRSLKVIGESAAGHPFAGKIGAGEAIRIFTGAAVPEGADAVLIQENAIVEGETLRPNSALRAGAFIRAAGRDFKAGTTGLTAGTRLTPAALALAAAMNHAELPAYRRPRLGLLATGDELSPPGPDAPEGATIASNIIGIAAMARAAGAEVINLGIARDNEPSLQVAFDRAMAEKADLLVTIGGASVGKHDLVRPVLVSRGAELDFYRIAMRPGKPLNFGKLGAMLYLGLPGNPVSAMVCATLFLMPLIGLLQGDLSAADDRSEPAFLGAPLAENDMREDYLRAALSHDSAGRLIATPSGDQDSSLLSVLHRADALLIRPAHAPAEQAGAPCRILRIP
ncbi:MAG: molybdopterin molybdotransferase MoeA [Rhizobiales bacterium]|nr:molybdopterin molybdotransferase MoeA [Hyphomicrobiales bacterium]